MTSPDTNAATPAAPWINTATRLPDEGAVVEVKDSGGHVQKLVRKGRLWFYQDLSMYVYFTPTAWRQA